MKRTAAAIALFALILLTRPAGTSAEDRVALRVTPRVAFAPANLIVRATVAADEQNRAIEIIADSRDFYRSSEIQLDGERAPRLTQITFHDVPQGLYEIRAVLKGSTGHELAATHTQVDVVGQ